MYSYKKDTIAMIARLEKANEIIEIHFEEREQQMKVFVFGAYTYKSYGERLVEIKVIAETKKEAYEIARDMCENSKFINIDEGLLLNDEYDY